MWISSRRSQAVLLTLFAMGGLGFGVTLWCADGPPLAAVSRDPVLQMQWRRVMALRIPAGEIPVEGIDKQPFSPRAGIPMCCPSRMWIFAGGLMVLGGWSLAWPTTK